MRPREVQQPAETEWIVRKTGLLLNRIALFGSLMLFALGAIGCGVKGPPVPPQAPPVAAVGALSYVREGLSAVLNWRLPQRLPRRQARGAVFGVYRSSTDLSEPACDDCPLVFEKVAEVPYVDRDDNRYSARVALDLGYRYRFKVRLETNGQAGADSDTVQFDVAADDPAAKSETP
jgi:hypothetical protein